MLFSVLCILVVEQVLSEVPPAVLDVQVDKWLLTWTPTTKEGNVTYTVQYRSFDSREWTNVPACVHISVNSCNVISTKAEDEHSCVMLRVQAERRGLTSIPVKACSIHGDSCTSDFSLTAGPGYLTVHLSRNHSLALEHADNVKHRVYYGKEGELLQKYKDSVASVTIRELQEGQRYCTKVQYIYFDRPVGMASCALCEVIPKSSKNSKQSEVAAIVVPVFTLLIVIPVMAYCFFSQHGRIKRLLRLPYQIPEHFLPEPFPSHCLPIHTSSPSEEHWDVISSVSSE